jgi:hypothetical protein
MVTWSEAAAQSPESAARTKSGLAKRLIRKCAATAVRSLHTLHLTHVARQCSLSLSGSQAAMNQRPAALALMLLTACSAMR